MAERRFGSRARAAHSLGELTTAAERLGSGDLSARVPEVAGEEGLAHLERSFNEMAASLQARLGAAEAGQRSKEELFELLGRELRASLSAVLGQLDALVADARGVEGLDSEERFQALEAGRRSAREALDLVNERLLAGSAQVRSGP
jgi:methyl-accepting chemotaxis protein